MSSPIAASLLLCRSWFGFLFLFLQMIADFCGRFVQSLCIILMKHFCSSSVSEDLGCRRGDFSRKHYGSVELVS